MTDRQQLLEKAACCRCGSPCLDAELSSDPGTLLFCEVCADVVNAMPLREYFQRFRPEYFAQIDWGRIRD